MLAFVFSGSYTNLFATDSSILSMKVICAWCQQVLTDDPSREAIVSHGICDACLREAIGGPVSLDKFVDSLDVPVLVMDGSLTVRAVNHAAEAIIGRPVAEMRNTRVGVAIKCVNGGAPGGCGQSTRCRGCMLRQNLVDTHADGRRRYGVYGEKPLTAGGMQGPLRFQYSTQKVGEIVLCLIEDLVTARVAS
jgi:PAS domain-containing protein